MEQITFRTHPQLHNTKHSHVPDFRIEGHDRDPQRCTIQHILGWVREWLFVPELISTTNSALERGKQTHEKKGACESMMNTTHLRNRSGTLYQRTMQRNRTRERLVMILMLFICICVYVPHKQ